MRGDVPRTGFTLLTYEQWLERNTSYDRGCSGCQSCIYQWGSESNVQMYLRYKKDFENTGGLDLSGGVQLP